MAILKGVQLDSSSTISFGDRELASDNLLNFDLNIAPETLEIQVDDPTAGHGDTWLWTWETSSLPYARTTITNLPQTVVPLYKQGVYQLNNYASNVHGEMTQTHALKLKWVEGAGDDNLISWVTYSTVVDSHPDINSGNDMTITRLTINVPSTITVPTLVTPNNISYFVQNMGFGAWSFVSDPNNQAFTGTNHGHNVTLGPWYRGGTYTINVNATGHPFYLTTDNGGNYVSGQYVSEYTDGVTGSRTQNGTLTITVPSDAPDTLYYQCGFHSAMRGAIRVQDLEVQTNVNGNYIVYAQHSQERHAQQIELRPIPAMVNQMCLVYDQVNDKFVPQDLATYVENTPSFKNKIQEVAGTAELVVEDGSAVVGKVTVYYDVSYLPILGNNPGDMAFATDTNILYIWDGSAWQQAGSTNADDLTEGNTNFFYTDARVDARLASGNVGDVIISGNLQVNGTTTTISSTDLTIDDKNIVLSNGSTNAITSDGAGITIDLGTDGNASLTYSSVNDRFEMNKTLFTNITGQISDITNHSINSLSDVDTVSSAPSDGQALLWNNANSEWVPGNVSQSLNQYSTDDLAEGSTNFYYTTARSNADFDTRYATKLDSSQKLITAGDNFTAGDLVVYDNGSFIKPLLSSSGLNNPVTESNGLSVSGSATSIIYDQVNDRYAVFRRDGSALYALVAQATSTGFTFGTELQFHNAYMNDCALAIDKNTNKIICAWVGGGASYADGGLRVAAFEIDPATNTITMGNIATDLDNPNVGYISIGYDTDSGKFLVIYGAYQDLRCNAGYVDGQNIVLGTRQSLTASGGPTWTGVAYDQTAQRFFVGHNANGRVAAVAQINSDNSITFGAWTTIPNTNNPGYPYYKKSEGKVYLPYVSTSFAATLGEVTIDNVTNTLTFNTLTVATNASGTISAELAYSELYDQFYFYYRNFDSTKYITDVVFTNGIPSLSNSILTSENYISQDKSTVGPDRVVGLYGTGPAFLVFNTFTSVNSNVSLWIGIAAENITSGNDGKVDMPGAINRNQTGLVTNSVYYVSDTGTLTTAPTNNGKIGKALSATELQISDISTHNTDNLVEGSTNLYYTDSRADARVNLQTGANLDLSQKTTTDLTEGTNLFYTNARAYAMISIF